MLNKKIIEYQDLPQVLQKLKNKKIVLTGGCFDIIHYGHYCLITNSKKLGDILLIALEPDEFIEKRKARKPFHTQQERAEILSGFTDVDYIVKLPFFKTDQEYFAMVNLIKPAIITITEGDAQAKNKIKQAKMIGAKIQIVCKLIKNLSSSNILNGKAFSRD